MGINFPDIRYIIHWGQPRNLLDYHQQSGRAGRDSKPSNVIIVYHGQQASFCEQDVKEFVHALGCYRIPAYKPFDHNIESIMPAHDCCNNCASTCQCEGNNCTIQQPQHDLEPAHVEVPSPVMTRPVSELDKEDLESGLKEVVNLIFPTLKLLDQNILSPDYVNELVKSLVERSNRIFTVKDIMMICLFFQFLTP